MCARLRWLVDSAPIGRPVRRHPRFEASWRQLRGGREAMKIDKKPNKQFQVDLRKLINYLWEDESKHYDELPSRNHIFVSIKNVAKSIGYDRH